ncbi:hypothetical protein DFP73DRAFT_76059 [Morchella snyderi]|nr:hypothetical protein DFP73DRAFT_76059 [Morchella snyderi]
MYIPAVRAAKSAIRLMLISCTYWVSIIASFVKGTSTTRRQVGGRFDAGCFPLTMYSLHDAHTLHPIFLMVWLPMDLHTCAEAYLSSFSNWGSVPVHKIGFLGILCSVRQIFFSV